jgi:putative ABC transport system permease protein
MAERARKAAPAAWRLLRRLLPRHFREMYADEMFAMHRDRAAARGWSRPRLWLAVAGDVIRTAVGARVDVLRRTIPAMTSMLSRRTLDAARMDIGYGVRQLVRAPVFTLVASVSLAVGIGVTVAALAVMRAAMFQPLPVQDPSHLYHVYSGHVHGRTMSQYDPSTYAEFERYRTSGVFSDAAAVMKRSVIMTGAGLRPDSRQLEIVTGNYFRLLGIDVQRGRWLGSEGQHDIVISGDYWRQTLGGSNDVLGRTIRIDGKDFTIAGIAPDEFRGSTPSGDAVAGWIDVTVDTALAPAGAKNVLRDTTNPWFRIVARLPQRETETHARARLNSLATSLGSYGTDTMTAKAKHGRVISLLSDPESRILPDQRREAYGAFAIGAALIAIVLLIGCANVAGLMLSRTMSRQHEVGVRLILGATARRMFVQLFTESVLLALIGGALGSGAAYAVLRVARRFPDVAALGIRVDPFTLAAALVISLLTTLAFGLSPVLQSLRAERKLATSSTHTSSAATNRARSRVLSVQIAASFVLVLIAVYAVRGVHEQLRVDPGFSPRGMVVADVNLYHFRDSTSATQYVRELRDEIAGTPGVLLVGRGQYPPLSRWRTSTVTGNNGEKVAFAGWMSVDAEYLQALGLKVRGRLMRASDTLAAHPVLVVNETYARAYEQELGSYMDMGRGQPKAEIIGVVSNVLSHEAHETAQPMVYRPNRGRATPWGSQTFLILVRPGTESSIALELEKRIAARWPESLPPRMQSMTSYIRETTKSSRIMSRVAMTVAAVELALAAVGLYGMQLYTVLARWKELGVRLALGATRTNAVSSVLRGTLRSAIWGLVAGGVIAAPAMMLFKGMIVGFRLQDPLPFLTACATIIVAVAIASLIPARRAAAISPAAALRHE